MEEKQLQVKIEEYEDRKIELKKKDTESDFLINNLQRVYQQQAEILEEFLYYSKGTEAERSARIDLEMLEDERTEAFRTFDVGKEELTELVSETERKKIQAEDDLLWLQKKQQAQKEEEDA
ncbi:hypothetical protein [Enterococcus sp. 5H]|uniref:hypothetical protein n=1 Tax=Enterococcus sp. 5H TaxID=1229490 RepID=UPI002303FEF0|nr:hypothetical protein [Enterococcus sp. 5H]MDA9471322.1 hypothetical protein [Enterococcus sp. 5H]